MMTKTVNRLTNYLTMTTGIVHHIYLIITGVRQQLNQNTHLHDGSHVYGSDKEAADNLRTFSKGQYHDYIFVINLVSNFQLLFKIEQSPVAYFVTHCEEITCIKIMSIIRKTNK